MYPHGKRHMAVHKWLAVSIVVFVMLMYFELCGEYFGENSGWLPMVMIINGIGRFAHSSGMVYDSPRTYVDVCFSRAVRHFTAVRHSSPALSRLPSPSMVHHQTWAEHRLAHGKGIWCAAPIPEQLRQYGHIITGGCDGLLKTWKIANPNQNVQNQQIPHKSNSPLQALRCFSRHNLPITDIAIAKNSPTVASASLDGLVKIWGMAPDSGDPKTLQQPELVETWCVAITGDGTRLLTGGVSGCVNLVDLSMGVPDYTKTISPKKGSVAPVIISAIALSEDESEFAIGCRDGTVATYDVETGKPLCVTMKSHDAIVRSVAYVTGDTGMLVTASDDRHINLYASKSGQLSNSFRTNTSIMLSATPSQHGRYLVSGGSDSKVRVWDLKMNSMLSSYRPHTDAVWDAFFVKGDSSIVSVSDDSNIVVADNKMDRE